MVMFSWQSKKKKNLRNRIISKVFRGANERSRTADLFITNEVLCLLSYVSVSVTGVY